MMQLPKEHAWKWHASDKVLPPMTQTPDVVSAKGSNCIVTNPVNQRTIISSYSASNNLQVHIVLGL